MMIPLRTLFAATMLASAAFVAAPAAAQSDTLDLTVTGNASIVSEYRFRGVDMSGGDFAVQGGVDVGHSSGIYIGTWGSSIDNTTLGYGHTKLDVYGGWKSEVSDGLTLDVGAVYYVYPNAGPGDHNTIELYGSTGFTFGPGEIAVGINYAPKQDSQGGDDNLYVYADADVGIPTTALSLVGHIGYTDGYRTFTLNNRAWDWSVGAKYAITNNLNIGVAYVGGEGDYLPGDYNFTDDTVVFNITAGF